ncbi:wHTH domain-containing protein [Actinomadura chokoriensis]|uniref:Caspase family protein n=1 Tax=Actinomadura chokoriensis TaxID=454156 RepID=A0ABV4R7J8_9ACTN
MGRFRALLLGVAEYQDPKLAPLPFVPDDLVNVATALEARGYATEIPDDSGRLGQTRIRSEVSRFLMTAQPNDTLLIYLSGHGAHGKGIDYLLPSDADTSWLPLADVAVPLNTWQAVIESSPAGGIVFLVDACREGFHEHTKSIAARTAWSQDKIARSERRNVAWLFPCTPGQVARYVPDGPDGTSFSLFAVAVERAIKDGATQATLTDFAHAVAEHMAALTAEHRLAPQRTRVAGEVDGDGFVVLPGSAADREADDWAAAAAQHVAWQKAADVHGIESLRDDVVSLVRHLAAARRRTEAVLASDPWHDERFALRMSARMSLILGSLLDDLRLTPAEAALLVALPFVHQVHWTRAVADASVVDPFDLSPATATSPERERFESYARGRPRLLRRAAAAGAAGDRETAGRIGWWLLHRCVTASAEMFGERAVVDSLAGWEPASPLAGEVLSAGRLSEMVRLLYADPGFIARTDRPHGLSSSLVVAPGLLGEQELRERLVAYLLVVAHRMAIETTGLPTVLVEHVGIPKSVVPADVLRSLDEARWEPRGSGRALRAACSHPAVEVALREHVGALDRLLADLGNSADPSLAGLKRLPRYADPSQVRAAETEKGPAYTSAGIRFQLNEARVQELLMGENLYGDADLAIREIYQNALDACRYRRARTEYLRATGAPVPEWEGRIRFTQGIDDQGRPYIECKDNGIGMGVRELRDVFAQAGARFAELPEFLEEQAEWESIEPQVKLYPNSQFGIGVLSYFMLADDITVTTCRLGRDGRPGERLKVSIAGPGTLFHIEPAGPGTDAGTVLRLYLRSAGDKKPVSCKQSLRNVLEYSEFHVEARDGAFIETWRPHEMKAYPLRVLYPHPDVPVWWCDGEGAILVDGLRTNESCFGVIVNLTGENVPELSVDRKEVLDTPRNRRILTRVLSGAVDAFESSEIPLPTFDWLCEFAEQQPIVADLIFQTALDAGRSFQLNGRHLDFARLGLLASDRLLLRPADSYRKPEYLIRSLKQRQERRGAEPLTDHLMRWRMAGLGRPGSRPLPGERARPSDGIILDANPEKPYAMRTGRKHCWVPASEPVSVRQFLEAATRTGYSIGEVADRLGRLGYDFPPRLRELGEAEPADLLITSRDLDGVAPWLAERDSAGAAVEVGTGHVVAAAAQLGRPISRVARRLAALGFTVPRILLDAGIAEPADRILLSRDLDGNPPWLEPLDAEGAPAPVPAGHIVSAAAQLGRDAARVADRLASLGFTVPGELPVRGRIEPDDRRLLSLELNGYPPMLPGARTVPLGHLVFASEGLGKGIEEIARRLVELGFRVPEAFARGSSDDLRILSSDFDDEPPWLGMEGWVRSRHVVDAATGCGRPVGEVARRLADLGFDLPPAILDAGDVQPGDDLLVTQYLQPGFIALRQWDDDDLLVPVPAGHIVSAAEKLGCSIGQAARRMAQLGFLVPSGLSRLDSPQPGDRVLASRDLTGDWPWLTDVVVPLGHVLTAAERCHRTPEETARRLEDFGFTVPALPHGPVDAIDLTLMSRELGVLPRPEMLYLRQYADRGWWLDQEVPVPLWNLVAGAVQVGIPIAAAADRLRALGFDVPDITDLPEVLDELSAEASLKGERR